MDLDLIAMGDNMNQTPTVHIDGINFLESSSQSETKQNLLGF